MYFSPKPGSAFFALAVVVSLWGAQPGNALAQTPSLNPQEGLRQGRQVVAELLSRSPDESVRTNTLRVRPRGRQEVQHAVRFESRLTAHGWITVYEDLSPGGDKLVVSSASGRPNQYLLTAGTGQNRSERKLEGNQTMIPFAGSDFWVVDLGLDFLHWPTQLLLKKELRKGQSCYVLESTNPRLEKGAYSRVVSWIDIDTGGIVHADAYDSDGRLLKLFDPSELQKVGGRMQVKEIEMRNRQTGSRSWVVFDLR